MLLQTRPSCSMGLEGLTELTWAIGGSIKARFCSIIHLLCQQLIHQTASQLPLNMGKYRQVAHPLTSSCWWLTPLCHKQIHWVTVFDTIQETHVLCVYIRVVYPLMWVHSKQNKTPLKIQTPFELPITLFACSLHVYLQVSDKPKPRVTAQR